ncbi:HD domain-containing protein [Candidatus Woesearchaeota archaeon]|nr:HD domain-containing protein [Candidatus Woesearchaeota archaeon]
MPENLEQELEQAYNRFNISEEQKNSLNSYLTIVRNRDEETWEHSARVGLKGIEVAELLHLDPKPLFYAGVLHDVGKALTDPESLKKKEGFNEKDMKELRKHPTDGYRLLKGIHDFSAEILLRHHRYGGREYPKALPRTRISFSEGTKAMIAYFSRVLGLIDFYDAITHRENDKFSPGNPRLPTREEAKETMLNLNKDQKYLINELYEAGIF